MESRVTESLLDYSQVIIRFGPLMDLSKKNKTFSERYLWNEELWLSSIIDTSNGPKIEY